MIELFDATGKKLASGHVVPDGGRVRVSTLMMDSAAPDIAAITRAAMGDAQPLHAVRHSPGYVATVTTGNDRDAREQARDDRKRKMSDAWKHPPALDPASAAATQRTTPAGGTVSDVTTPNAAWLKKQAKLAEAWKNGAQ